MKIALALGPLIEGRGVPSATIENEGGKFYDASIYVRLNEPATDKVLIEVIDVDAPERGPLFCAMIFPGSDNILVANLGTLFGGFLPKRWAVQASAPAQINVDLITMEVDDSTIKSVRRRVQT